MKYIASAAVILKGKCSNYEKNTWHTIQTDGQLEYMWRLTDSSRYEVIAAYFYDREMALLTAKQMYVTLLYDLLKNSFPIENAGCNQYEPVFFVEELDGDREDYYKHEKFFDSNKNDKSLLLGPRVYEVNNSIDELNSHRFVTMEICQMLPISFEVY